MTLTAAATASGLSIGTVTSWMAGRRVPFRESLDRLAQVVDEPALVHLIPSRPGEFRGHRTQPMRMTCRDCRGVRCEQAGLVRAFEKLLHPHRREDFITKIIDIEYSPEAPCERWERFLEEVLPKPAVRQFIH